MNILIASDSFKEALTALEVCQAIAAGVQAACPTWQTRLLPLADGGEGTAEVLRYHSRGKDLHVQVRDPLGRTISATYALSGDGQTAFIEMAAAAGLPLLGEAERNPLLTSTQGVGEMLLDAWQRGAKRIVLGLGGSATNDGGMGMARALGYRFLDRAGHELQGIGAELEKVDRIDGSRLLFDPKAVEVLVLCDVDNPLAGPKGAAVVYAPQKGADAEMVERLDAGLGHFGEKLSAYFGRDYASVPGAGAAGGMGAGTMAFLNGQLRPGIEVVMALSGFDEALQTADLVITGEGKIDQQTLHGKLIHGICKRAAIRQVPVIALCGALLADAEQIKSIGLQAAFSIQQQALSLDKAIQDTARNLQQTAGQIAWLISAFR
ncbi:MAG TPA: glycerate kinase [Saprospiraceae bacterium]|nr:glycerate kinase [Saprospiraceae bacterium]